MIYALEVNSSDGWQELERFYNLEACLQKMVAFVDGAICSYNTYPEVRVKPLF